MISLSTQPRPSAMLPTELKFSMTVLVKKPGLSIPEAIAKKAGIKPGDWVEFTVRRGAITILASPQLNESRYPLYTPTKAEAAAIRRGRAEYNEANTSPSTSSTMNWTLLVTKSARKPLVKLPDKRPASG